MVIESRCKTYNRLNDVIRNSAFDGENVKDDEQLTGAPTRVNGRVKSNAMLPRNYIINVD